VPDSTYDMVGGLDKQIQEIKEVIELPIKHPELFDALGVAQPKGVLLYGPPGTGKTLLARAVAHHTDCTFIRVSGSELVQKYIGEGSRMVRELFIMAREAAPTIIFMDEIDSIGTARTEGGGGDSEVQRTMLELLAQLDGFEATQNIKMIMVRASAGAGSGGGGVCVCVCVCVCVYVYNMRVNAPASPHENSLTCPRSPPPPPGHQPHRHPGPRPAAPWPHRPQDRVPQPHGAQSGRHHWHPQPQNELAQRCVLWAV